MTTVRKWPRAKSYRPSVAEIKALVRYRDGYRCTECGMTARQHFKKYGWTLEVHRLVPGSRYTLRGCVTLCTACHGPKPRLLKGSRTNVSAMLSLPPDLYQQLKILAEMNGRPVSWEIRLTLIAHLKEAGLWPPPADEDE